MTTDITALAQREKFEAWFVNDVVGADVNFPAFKDGEYTEGEIYDEQLYFMLQAMWMAWKAAGAELVETLEKAQQRIDSQREYYDGVIADGGKRIAELESRTVKLPPCVDDLHGIGMVMSADAVIEMLAAAGIKVEAE
ncbi:hypothetical protein LGM15_10480 [Klebsiella pneumoniae]|uniref:hypothetical protein n=1 Tax=Klebsiella pneumoniae TaxID=573 RepID=UPI001CFCDD77|nr:hypothetical protein [Klebsiella pneumoniae]UDD14448.1 hypothetical protein LGM15_10480 [Klebsiella pneumoniae]